MNILIPEVQNTLKGNAEIVRIAQMGNSSNA